MLARNTVLFGVGLCVAALAAYVYFGGDEPAAVGRYERVTPVVVHRVWLGDPADVPVARSAWEYTATEVREYGDQAALRLVAKHAMLDVWALLPNAGAKADLVRYLVLYEHGGWYADTDVEPMPLLSTLVTTHRTVLFNEACGWSWVNRLKYRLGVSTITHAPQFRNSLFACPPGWPPLRTAIALLRGRVLRHGTRPWRITDTINLTGPGLLTDAVLRHPDYGGATVLPCIAQRSLFVHHSTQSWASGVH